jgi:type IV pilus assembly protein PilC
VAVYAYRARDELGRLVRGALAAASEEELARQLEASRLCLVAAAPERAGRALGRARVSRRDLIDFSNHMALSLSAGVPLLAALGDLAQRGSRRGLQEVLGRVRQAVQDGSTFSEALALHPRAFPQLYVAIVGTGEVTGRLDGVLRDLAAFLEWQEGLISQVRQATYYPAAVLAAVVGLVALLMGFVFPRFMAVFIKSNVTLPLPTRIVMQVSHLFSSGWPYLLAALAAAVAGWRLARRYPGGRLAIDRAKLGLPIFGNVLAKVSLSRFAHYLESLLRGGVEIMQSLAVTEKVVGNEVFSLALARARQEVATGRPLSEALEATGCFPPEVVRFVALGELSGRLDEVLGRLNAHYDREIPATIKRAFAVFEPVVIAMLAAVVLGMALSMFLPLYQMLDLVAKGGG